MKAFKIRVYGIVQGVGFRPFVNRLAVADGLCGTVCNKGSFVEISVQGEEAALMRFQTDLKDRAPERAVILNMDVTEQQPGFFHDFQIIVSEEESGHIFVPPDIAICPTCKTELYDKTNRRYLHPFINCTACGPRLTILKQMPYDRERTTMGAFEMCADCAGEYRKIGDRRYDAQPVCCPDCGPRVYLMDEPCVQGADAIRRTREVIRAGGIAAVKGIGGFHLCCDAGNEEAVRLLRTRKSRPAKPFAVMVRDLETAKRICEIDDRQEKLLDSPQKPIVIGRKADAHGAVASAVAPDNPTLGVMLPYAPLQLLLFHDPADDADGLFPDVLVMTSGNRGGAPICRNDGEVREQLADLCDIVLSHDRDILIRADDSVVAAAAEASEEPFMLRRSRGYSPLPVTVSEELTGQVLAIGGELKNTFCIGQDSFFYPSPYIGDLSDLRSERALVETVERMLALFEAVPQAAACDLHPDYRTRAVAQTMGLPVIAVQHHYAHVLSCMGENDAWSEKVIGVALDGTGFGTDGTVWGGEFLLADKHGFTRAGSLRPFWQMGGDAAAKEGWRIALSLLLDRYETDEAADLAYRLGLCGTDTARMSAAIKKAGIYGVTSTSAGRLFDAVSALLGIRNASTFEGEAAMALQYTAERAEGASVLTGIPCWDVGQHPFVLLDYMPLFERLLTGRLAGEPAEMLAYLFHEQLAEGILCACEVLRRRTGRQTVALSGGCFCNRLLLRLTKDRLETAGFQVLTHHQIPANDGGIALGQALYAMEQLNRKL